ncbi:hypothetical protein [Pedomonas mirosovicensis]|uniref:hypothetical protein n=1 Tax=Pedomonas mirosovicensis TaxID=2908641 RepID=UPI002169A909|nr:hypothetical protein [Pedomonas mirosovicensis]MCH8685026.1 hypothetical protein [Pedomonas mirosovicensis]
MPLTEAFWEELADSSSTPERRAAVSRPAASHLAQEDNGWFVSAYWLEADMATWERHSRGDRLVIAETGSFTLVLDHQNGGRRRRLPLDAVGSVLVPCGCWHRLTVNTPGLVLFISPAHGMEHRPV